MSRSEHLHRKLEFDKGLGRHAISNYLVGIQAGMPIWVMQCTKHDSHVDVPVRLSKLGVGVVHGGVRCRNLTRGGGGGGGGRRGKRTRIELNLAPLTQTCHQLGRLHRTWTPKTWLCSRPADMFPVDPETALAAGHGAGSSGDCCDSFGTSAWIV